MAKPNLFELFGGTRKMALAMGEAPSTVQSWKATGRIPAHRQPAVLETARELGLEITADDIVFPMGADHDAPDTIAVDAPSPGKSSDVTAQAVTA